MHETYAQSADQQTNEGLRLAHESRSTAASGDIQAALSLANSALDLLNQASQPMVVAYLHGDRSNYLARLGRFDEAIVAASTAIEQVSAVAGENSDVRWLLTVSLGRIYLATGNVDTGRETLEAAYHELDTLPTHQAGIAASLSRSLTASEDLSRARIWVDRGLKGKPEPQVLGELVGRSVELHLMNNDLSQAQRVLAENKDQLPPLVAQYIGTKLDFERGNLHKAEISLTRLLRDSEFQKSPHALQATNRLAHIYLLMGRIVEAQEIYRNLIAEAVDRSLPQNHPSIARTLHALAMTHKSLGQFELANDHYQRAIAILDSNTSQQSESAARTRLEYSLLLSHQKMWAEAAELAREAISIIETKPNASGLGLAKAAYGLALKGLGETKSAEQQLIAALQLLRQTHGDKAAQLTPGLLTLAQLVEDRDVDRAESLIDEAIELHTHHQSTTLSGLVTALTAKALLQLPRHPKRALITADSGLNVAHNNLLTTSDQRDLREITQSRSLFEDYLRIAGKNLGSNTDRKTTRSIKERMLLAAQFPTLSLVSATINQSARRVASDNKKLSDLLEERQRLRKATTETSFRIERLIAHTPGGTPSIDRPKYTQLVEEKRNIAGQLSAVNAQIQDNFPQFSEAAFPRPTSVKSLQRQLRKNEAAYAMIAGPKYLYLFLVTDSIFEVKVVSYNLNRLNALVRAVRLTTDLRSGQPRPFNIKAAHALYQLLLGPFEAQLSGIDHLIYVPDYPVSNIPFGLLVRQPTPAQSRDYSNVSFLQADVGLSMVPSLSSLVALRAVPADPNSTSKLLGIGDPVLGKLAAQSNTRSNNLSGSTHLLHANLTPLPDTVDELGRIGKSFEEKTLLFNTKASERSLYEMQDLDTYNVIIFATHGLLRDDVKGVTEPALVLSQDDNNNGLLYASEIADLSLRADWVILSACNTAASDGSPGAEGLSGLAKSFFFAGATGLLVSHWSVDSTATVEITTAAMHAYHKENKPRSMSLKDTLRSFIDGRRGAKLTHPAYWAPFVFVGDGAI